MIGRQRMYNITCALPQIYVDNLQKIQDIGLVPSRSEAIRIALHQFLKQEIKNAKLLGFSGDD